MAAANKGKTVEMDNYQTVVKRHDPPHHMARNLFRAFVGGGSICLLAQIIQYFIELMGFPAKTASGSATIIMLILAMLITGLGFYDRLAQWAGAGSAVPITGFANSMVSAAMEYRSEGFVLGIGANMFKVAGPVIVYGCVAAFIVGTISYWIGRLL